MHQFLRNITALGFLGWGTVTLALHGCSSRLGPVRASQNVGGIGRATLPDITIEQAKECMADYGSQLALGLVELKSTVEVDGDRYKLGVTLDGVPDMAPDFAACMRNVLRDMPIAEGPFQEGVTTLQHRLEHVNDGPVALRRFIEVIPGVPIVESELVLEADGHTVLLPVTIRVVDKQVKQIDLDKALLAKIGQLALDSLGYDEIMKRAEQMGWVKWVPIKQAQVVGDKRFIGDGPLPANVQEIVKESLKLVLTKTAPVALMVSQLDTPAPGPGDAVAVGIFFVSLVAAGGVSVYIYVQNKTAEGPTTSVGAPAPPPQQPPPPPLPPPPPPPPPPPRETCEANSELKKIIRCDDPGISHYDPLSEKAAFRKIVESLGQGLSKGKSKDDATTGPCEERGGFHTNVLRRGKSVASIMGCNCCDDSSGKAIQKERTRVRYK